LIEKKKHFLSLLSSPLRRTRIPSKNKNKNPSLLRKKKTTLKKEKNGEDCKAKKRDGKISTAIRREEAAMRRRHAREERATTRERTHCDDDEGAAVKRTSARVESGGRSGRYKFYPGQVYATSPLATYLGCPRVRLLLAVFHLLFWPFLAFCIFLLFSFLFIFFSYYYY
jgi:hypothetical protein